jgi:hypothetical protein
MKCTACGIELDTLYGELLVQETYITDDGHEMMLCAPCVDDGWWICRACEALHHREEDCPLLKD